MSDQTYLQKAGGKSSNPSSIYEENPVDPRVGIPANTHMFDNVVKDAFNFDDSSSDEEEKAAMLNEKEMLQKCVQIYEDKNPLKLGRLAGPSQRKLNKLDSIDQAKIISKRNQIKVAKREDGLMLEGQENSGNVLNYMFKKFSNNGYYENMFKRLVTSIKKHERNQHQL